MATEDPRNDGPSLELPSFGFRRRKRRPQPVEPQPVEPQAVEESQPVEETRPMPATASVEPIPDPGPEPAPTPRPVPTPDPEPRPAPTPDPEPRPAPTPRPVPDPEPQPAPVPTPEPQPGPVATRVRPAETEAEDTGTRRRRKPRRLPRPSLPRPSLRRPRLPAVGARTAVVVTGVLVGLATVLLTAGSLRGCELVGGTATCGGGPGLLLLVVIFVLTGLLGGALLRVLRVSDPVGTSFLGVGLLAVVALLFLIDVLMSWWMLLVVPLVAAATFALSRWVTTAFVETADG